MDAFTHADRRAVSRLPGNTIEPIRVRLDGGETVASVQDISIAGIGIVLGERVEPGTWLVLEPGKPTAHLSSELRAEVRRTTKRDGDYLIGCRFSRYLTIDDLMTLG